MPIDRIDYFTNKINAAYFQDHVTLFKRLKFQFAGRYDIYRRDVRRDNWRNGAYLSLNLAQKRAQEAFTYRAGAVYDLTFAAAKSFTPVTSVPNNGRELRLEHGGDGQLRLHASLVQPVRRAHGPLAELRPEA